MSANLSQAVIGVVCGLMVLSGIAFIHGLKGGVPTIRLGWNEHKIWRWTLKARHIVSVPLDLAVAIVLFVSFVASREVRELVAAAIVFSYWIGFKASMYGHTRREAALNKYEEPGMGSPLFSIASFDDGDESSIRVFDGAIDFQSWYAANIVALGYRDGSVIVMKNRYGGTGPIENSTVTEEFKQAAIEAKDALLFS